MATMRVEERKLRANATSSRIPQRGVKKAAQLPDACLSRRDLVKSQHRHITRIEAYRPAGTPPGRARPPPPAPPGLVHLSEDPERPVGIALGRPACPGR